MLVEAWQLVKPGLSSDGDGIRTQSLHQTRAAPGSLEPRGSTNTVREEASRPSQSHLSQDLAKNIAVCRPFRPTLSSRVGAFF